MGISWTTGAEGRAWKGLREGKRTWDRQAYIACGPEYEYVLLRHDSSC